MIPGFTLSGVLPPFVGASPAAGISPYATTIGEVAQRLVSNKRRLALLCGLIALRRELADLGIREGVQWIDGSFCERCEENRRRPPGDIDLVTLFFRPADKTNEETFNALVQANQHLFLAAHAKARFGCEAFYVDLSVPQLNLLPQVTYWFGLFTHQRESNQWKGLLQISLDTADDQATLAHLDTLDFPDEEA